MSIESIESLAKSFDNELRQLELLSNSSAVYMSPHHRNSKAYDPEHSFELAAQESERERLHDKLNDLTERVGELELQNRHQESMINHLKKRNKELENRLLRAGDSYHREDVDLDQSILDDESGQTRKMYRLQCKMLEVELRETKLLLEQTQRSSQLAEVARKNAELERQEEVAIRVHAVKQRDAYASAYRQALKHIEKWST